MSCVATPKKKNTDKPEKTSSEDLVDKVNRTGKPLYVYIEGDLDTALKARLKASRRTKTEEVSIALEEYLAKHGNWPLPKNGHSH